MRCDRRPRPSRVEPGPANGRAAPTTGLPFLLGGRWVFEIEDWLDFALCLAIGAAGAFAFAAMVYGAEWVLAWFIG